MTHHHHPRMARATSLLSSGATTAALREIGDLVEALSGRRQPDIAWFILGGLARNCGIEGLQQLLETELARPPRGVGRARVEIVRSAARLNCCRPRSPTPGASAASRPRYGRAPATLSS